MRCGYGKPLQEALPALPLLLQRAMQSTRYLIPERSQQIATRICADARQRGNEEDQQEASTSAEWFTARMTPIW